MPPPCVKVAYATHHEAELNRKAINAEGTQERRLIRSYLCHRCEQFHLTSQEKRTVVAFDPSGPITRRRRLLWAALQAENTRANLAAPYPWSTSRRSAAA